MKKSFCADVPRAPHSFFSFLALLLAMATPAKAAFERLLNSTVVENSFYILDSDDGGPFSPSYHGFQTDFEVTVRNTAAGDGSQWRHYRVCYQLMRDNNGSPVPVTLEGGGTIGYSNSQVILLPSGVNSNTFTLEGLAIPQDALIEKEQYFVRGQLQSAPFTFTIPPNPPPPIIWTDVVGQVEDSFANPQGVAEFNNTTTGDLAFNIETLPYGLIWDKTYALATDPSDDGFGATFGFFALRYDEYDVPQTSINATFIADFDLIEQSTGNSIPLENDGIFTQVVAASSYRTGTRPTPVSIGAPFFGIVFQEQIVPLVQLDSVNETYILRATARHVEDPFGNEEASGTCELPAEQLLHFNGSLDFGPLATTVNELGNVPAAGTSGPTFVNTVIQVPTDGGTLDSRPDVNFGSGSDLNVRLFDNGDMLLTGGSQAAYLADGSGDPITCATNPLLEYQSVILNTAGATATGFDFQLPQGTVFFPNLNVNEFMGESILSSSMNLALDSDLCHPNTITLNFGSDAAVADESHPLLFGTSMVDISTTGQLSFDIAQARYTHQKAFEELQNLWGSGQLDSIDMIERCSNDRYYLNIVNVSGQAVFASAADGTSRMNVAVEVNPGSFRSHFPKKSAITYNDPSQVEIVDGEIDNNTGSALKTIPGVTVPYYQTCDQSPCASGLLPVPVSMKTQTDELFFTTGGGLYAESSTINSGAGHQLEWGKRSATQYAHRTGTFDRGRFYMPGYQLYASENDLIGNAVYAATAADNAVGTLLLSGFNGDVSTPDLHTPVESGYRDGEGSLPGMTFEVLNPGMGGASRLAGEPSDYGYDLLEDQGNGGSKYYIRESGVGGRQVGTDGTYDPSLNLHGFPCKIDQFQLTFLENTNEADGCISWVDGSVEVQGFSNWNQTFTGLRFDCLGEPGEMTVDLSDADDKSLSYWNSFFDLKTLEFITFEDPVGSCTFKGKLAAGVKTRVSHVDQDLFGTLAFCPDGNLSTLQDALDFPVEFDGIDSQLRLPANIPLDGPNDTPYNLVPTGKLRFNNPNASGAPGVGFVTFAATIDIPYFRDLNVQAITTASGSPGAAFALTPGWEQGGETFFSLNNFDPTHRGFPPSGGGVPSYDDYRDPANAGTPVSETYLIKAEQDLFGFIPLSYPLFWSDGTRRFASNKSIEQDIFVAQMEHKVDWMDAKFTNISFGATYDGLPQLKLSNWLNGEIDKASAAISDALGTLPKQAIDKGLSELEKMLEDALCELINPLVDEAAGTPTDPGPIRDLYQALYTIHLNVLAGSDNYNDFRTQLKDILDDPSDALFNAVPALADLRDHLCLIADTGAEAASFLNQIETAVEDIIKGIDSITQGIDQTQDYTVDISAPNLDTVALGDKVKGLLYEEVGELQIIDALIDLLLVELVDPAVRDVIQPLLESATSELNAKLNTLLEDVKPALLQIKDVLITVRGFLVEVHGQVASAGDIVDKFTTMVTDAKNGNLLNELLRPVTTRAWSYFLQVEQALGIPDLLAAGADFNEIAGTFFANFTEDEFVQLIKDELKDAILQSDIVKQTQYLLRQTLYDIADKVTSALQSVLAEVTNVMKEVISDTIGALEEEINPLLGQISKYMGSGEISGYCEFNGDSLRKLRLDAKMQFEIPEEMALHVYLEILAYTSEDNFVMSGCIEPGEKMVEVRIGARDVSVEWISECKINLEVKLSLKDFDGEGGNPPLPIGVGGTFELSDGEIDFQAFKLLEFGATMAVGLEECYIGAKARATFSSNEIAAAFFFGRACTLEPLLFVDPDIGDVVEAGTTFTGGYIYGEFWTAVSEVLLGIPASCLFRIDAGIGAGAFYFFEGPTIGGKIFLGVSGEALCVVSIRGEIKIILASQAGRLRGAGTGKFSAKVGWCPFCIKFSRSVKLIYDDGSWSMQ